jgi:hypothetical protein
MNISQLTDILQIDAYLRLYVFAYSFTDIMLVWIEVWRVSTHINGKTKKKKTLKKCAHPKPWTSVKHGILVSNLLRSFRVFNVL